jgi:threonine dehydratase
MIAEAKDVLLAKVYDVAKVTPCDFAPNLSYINGCDIYLKREDLQSVHSFKLRGAYNKIANLNANQRSRGVIAASAGNHAQGVALAAKKLGISSLIVMPKTTPGIKVKAVQHFGADIELHGDNYSEAAEYALELVKKTGRVYIHPFDDALVIAGQGTVGKEIIEQVPDVTHIFVPVGGGGLLAGVAQYVKALKPDVKIISVEPDDSNAMQQSLKMNNRIIMPHVGIFADGVAVKQVGKNTYKIAKKYVDLAINVNNDQICAAIKSIFEETRSVVEPAGALAVAGIIKYAANNDTNNAVMVAINSGANITFERLQFIAERTLIGSNKESLYSVDMPEEPGALKSFCNNVVKNHNITQFAYRLQDRNKATIMVGIGTRDTKDRQKFESNLIGKHYKYLDMTTDDLAKQHIRHMIGGKAEAAKHEHFYKISFPERSGALGEFLSAVSGVFNISLFHYRGQGGDIGYVLIGFEAKSKTKLERALKVSSYDWQNVDYSKSLNTFIA